MTDTVAWSSLLVVTLVVLNTFAIAVTAAQDESNETDRRVGDGDRIRIDVIRATQNSDDDPPVVEGDPEISGFAPNRTVAPGQRRQFVVQIVNDGELERTDAGADPADEQRVATARNVQVTLEGDGPVEVRGGTVGLGDIEGGQVARAGFEIVVPGDADPGTYDLPVEVEYEVIEESDEADRDGETVTAELELLVTEDARFAVASVDTDLQVGATGTVEAEIENVGEQDVTEATVHLESRSANLRLDSTDSTERFVGEFEAGDEEAVDFQVTAKNDSASQAYAIQAVVAYTDEDGNRQESQPVPIELQPAPEQRFRIANLTSRLTVNEEGVVQGRLENAGPRNVSAAALGLETTPETLVPREREYALGNLLVNETRRFAFRIDSRESAEPGPRQLRLRVEYVDQRGDRRRSDLIPVRVVVAPETDAIAVRTANASVAAGSTGTVTLVIRNTRRVTLRNINAQLFPTDPLRSGDDQAFVATLEPNQTTRLRFDVSATEGASPKSYPLKLDFQYETPDGETELSNTYQIGVRVTEPDGGLLGSLPWAVVAVVVPTAGVYLWHRYQR